MVAGFLVPASLLLSAVVLVLAAVGDVRRFLIPNRLVLVLCVLFAIHAAATLDAQAIGIHLAVASVVLMLGAALFAAGGIGGGDVKLMAAAALWAGPDRLGLFLVTTALAGAVVSAVAVGLALRARARNPDGNAGTLRKVTIPYGVAIASGGLVVLALIASSPGS